jgi:hypothetical protein
MPWSQYKLAMIRRTELLRNEITGIPNITNQNSNFLTLQTLEFQKKSDRNLWNQKRDQNSACNGGPRNWTQKLEFPTKDMIAALFEAGQGHEEEKGEEGEGNRAPRPPSMMTEACKENVAAGHKATKKPPVLIQDGVAPQVPEERIASAHEADGNITIMQDIINSLMQEVNDVFNNDGTPVNMGNQESLLGPSSSSNVQVGAPSIN